MQLQGENIYVKLVEEADADALLNLEVENRDFFQRFTGLRDESFYTWQGQRDRIKAAIKEREEDTGYWFIICLKESKEVIGEVSLFGVIRGNLQSCWIGYFLDKGHNGKGYMTEAVKLVVNYAFKKLKIHRIEAGVMPHNIGSIQVLLKSGFHKEGISKKNVKINGRWEDHQLLAVINDDEQETGICIQDVELKDWEQFWNLMFLMGKTDHKDKAYQRFQQHFSQQYFYIPAAFMGEAMVGYAIAQDYGYSIRTGKKISRLHDLFVLPMYRNQGIATQLLEHVKTWAKNNGTHWLQWNSSPEATRFYKKLGIASIEEDPDRPLFEIEF